MASNRTKACNISNKVRKAVLERDECCIFCGRQGQEIMHYEPRSKGGLGVEQNLALGCVECHRMLDQSPNRSEMRERFKAYLKIHYKEWKEENLIYERWVRKD